MADAAQPVTSARLGGTADGPAELGATACLRGTNWDGMRPLSLVATIATLVAIVTFPSLHAQAVSDPDSAHRLAVAKRLLQRAPLIDGHNDIPWRMRGLKPRYDFTVFDLRQPRPTFHADIARLEAGGLGGQFWSVYVPGTLQGQDAVTATLEQIDLVQEMLRRYPDTFEAARTAADVERITRARRIASMMGMEGGHSIDRSLGVLREFSRMGVGYMTLTHNVTLPWADAANDVARHGGLTAFGEEVVREMNRIGMLVDLSHTSPDTMHDALRVSEAPVIFSHSSARAVCDHPRNVPDAVLAKMKANGGVVMVTFVNAFVSPEWAKASGPLWKEYEERTRGVTDPAERARIGKDVSARMPKTPVPLALVADHVDHVRKVAGVDHVGLGGDYDGNDAWPEGLEDVSGYPRLLAELARRGWSDEDLGKLASGNALRVLRRAEEVARRLSKERPPSTATLEALDGTKK